MNAKNIIVIKFKHLINDIDNFFIFDIRKEIKSIQCNVD